MNSVVAIYETSAQAEQAVKELQRSGLDMKKVSIVVMDYHRDEHVVGDRAQYWGGAELYSIGIPKDSVEKYESTRQWEWQYTRRIGSSAPVLRADSLVSG